MNEAVNKRYMKWLNEETLDKDLLDTLKKMDESEIEEAFYKHLDFGTGGMRGIVGPGTNRMNIYTVRKAAYGYAEFLMAHYENAAKRGVVIAHDNRHMSDVFTEECVGVLSAFGIKTYIYDTLHPTPMLSYGVRLKEAAGGIMVTASHNPPEYNGVKMYDHTGCQLIPDQAEKVIQNVNNVEDLFTIERLPIEKASELGLLETMGEEVDDSYIKEVHEIQYRPDLEKRVKVVFTPLHGASATVATRSLREAGYDVYPVESQMVPDPEFTTVASPNPEYESAFGEAKKLGRKVDADLLVATDPDGDRFGVMVRHEGEYHFLSGNQTAAIFAEYILSQERAKGALSEKSVFFQTIVSSEFAATIARKYDVDVQSTLTGFKFIGDQINRQVDNGDKTFTMAYEESYGYILRSIVRDKDSLMPTLLITEIANVLKHDGKTIVDYLNGLYQTYGAFKDKLISIVLKGREGTETIQSIMTHFRGYEPEALLGKKLLVKEDYLYGTRKENGETKNLDYPESNVIKFIFEDDLWFVLRPSGTEPKLKIYLNLKSDSMDDANAMLSELEDAIMAMLEPFDID
ncbi:MAG: phospho-sugar mutase [Bacillota bacterium]